MRLILSIAIGALLGVLAGACTYERANTKTASTPAAAATTPEARARAAETADQKKANLEAERDRIINNLYAEYGGGSMAQSLGKEASEEDDSDIVHDLKAGAADVMADTDRTVFARRCNNVGEGEEQSTATDREKAFFAQASVIEACREVARINDEIDAIH